MKNFKPLQVWLERSVSPALHSIISPKIDQFELVKDPEEAEVIVFEKDIPSYIRETIEFKKWPQKCIVISECDQPTYFLPACYSSNKRWWLSRNRTTTIPYIISQRSCPNPFITNFENNAYCPYLYSFIGGSTSWARKKLFRSLKRNDNVYIQETNHYYHWNNEQSYNDEKMLLQKQYAEILKQSSFFLCPRGAGVSSIRLFEVMEAGKVPVIISDRWIPIEGIEWDKISLFIPERKISKIDSIIRDRQLEAEQMGILARKEWKEFCSPEVTSQLLARSIRIIQNKRNERKEIFLRFIFPLIEVALKVKLRIFKVSKYLILRFFDLTNQKWPYSLNRTIKEQTKRM